jgi:urease accessory protein
MGASISSPARSLHGRLDLRFARDGDRTRLACIRRTPPFHVQRLLHLDPARPALARAVVLNTTAGVCAGDRLALTIRVEPTAAVELTSPAMTRVHAMPDGHAETTTRIFVEAGAYLEFLPEPLLLCRDAALRQQTELCVAPGGVAALGEVIAFGRAAHGELHAYRELDQRTTVLVAGEPRVAENLRLRPNDEAELLGVIGRFAAYGSLTLICPEGQAGDVLALSRQRLAACRDIWGGASMLAGGAGVGVRILTSSARAAQITLRAVIDDFRERASFLLVEQASV